MATWRLLTGLAFALGSAAMFTYVGRMQMRRQVVGEARVALNLFAIWWYALGAVTFGGAVFNVIGHLGVRDVALWQVYTYLAIGGICLALWGLLYYLVYLFTGQTAWLPILSVFYVFVYVYVLYWVQVQIPNGIQVTEWSVQLSYAKPDTGILSFVILLVIVVPQILAGLAYFTLFFRVRERAQRYRIALVSWSIVGWFGSSVIAAFLPEAFRESDGWQVLQRLIGLTAAALIVMAYKPPAGIQRWLAAGTPEGGQTAKPVYKPPTRRTNPVAGFARELRGSFRELFRVQPVGALF